MTSFSGKPTSPYAAYSNTVH